VSPSQPKNQRVSLKTVVPGPNSRAFRAREDAHLAPGVQAYALASGVVVERAQGSAVTDVDGNTFLDLIGGIGVAALGHSHPTWVSVVQEQSARVAIGSLTSPARVLLLDRLAAHAPAPDVDQVQLYSSGAEAVESAVRLAKAHTGRHEIVSFWGGFHGKTLGAMALMGSSSKRGYGPLPSGVHHVPYADCYRCPFGKSYPSCDLFCASFVKTSIEHATAGGVAAFVVEPMQGTSGNVVPPDTFVPRVAEIARAMGALVVVDEMITGFGRTGAFWGVEHSGAAPDVVTIGKAFGGGFPLSGVLTTAALARTAPWSNPSSASSSYGGNPLAAAAGAASLGVLDDERLVENARDVGAHMLERLRAMEEKYPFVGFVDGRGLFLRVELVRDKKTKQPIAGRAARRIFDECVRRGLLTMSYSPSFRIQPALTIDRATADNALAVLEEVFDWTLTLGFWE
jgi:4-aminobutyrate aminotransferase-like enzyme